MRTTVTLDADVVRLLKDKAHSRGTSFKIALNDSVREAFHQARSRPQNRKAFKVKSRPLGLRPGIDPTRLDQIAGDMDVDSFLALSKRLKKKM